VKNVFTQYTILVVSRTTHSKFKLNSSYFIYTINTHTKRKIIMSKDDEEVLLDYNEEDDAVQEPTKEKEVKASK
jgi:hypothetical protein